MAARPVSEAEQPAMYSIVRELATSAHQPMPRLYISPTVQPNAFATGRNPRHAAVCAPRASCRSSTVARLRAVLGHELSHVYNRDILISSVAGTLAAAITYIAQFAFFFGGGDDDRDRNPFVELIDAHRRAARGRAHPDGDQPLAGVSGRPVRRQAATTRWPWRAHCASCRPVRRQLPLPQAPSLVSTSHLMIANPFRGQGMASLFATHPPMEQRIARLEAMAQGDPRYWSVSPDLAARS